MDIYKVFIKTYGIYIVVISIVAGTFGFVSTRFMPTSYDVALSLAINREDDQSDQYYSYDGFYAIQAEDQFSKSVTTWFDSPDFVRGILDIAGEKNVDTLSVKDFRKAFTSEQISATGVEVSFGVKEESQGVSLTQAINQAVNERLDGQERNEYQIFIGEPVIRATEYNPVFWGVGGFLFGLVVSVAGFSIREYLK